MKRLIGFSIAIGALSALAAIRCGIDARCPSVVGPGTGCNDKGLSCIQTGTECWPCVCNGSAFECAQANCTDVSPVTDAPNTSDATATDAADALAD